MLHVSNGGKRTFYVQPSRGEVEVVGPVRAGETYRYGVLSFVGTD